MTKTTMTAKSLEKSDDTNVSSIEGKAQSKDKHFYQYVVAFSGEINERIFSYKLSGDEFLEYRYPSV